MAQTRFLVCVHCYLDIKIWRWVKVMTHPWVMDNNCVKYMYYPDRSWQWGVKARTRIPANVRFDHVLGYLTLGQGHDTPMGHGQQLSRSKLAVRSYGPDTDFWYVCNVTLTLEIWPWVKIMTHPWAKNNNCVKYPDPTWQWRSMARKRIWDIYALWPWPWNYDLGSRSWHTLLSLTILV